MNCAEPSGERSMVGANFYGTALFVLVAWIILIGFVVARPGRSGSAPRSHHLHRPPCRFERKPSPDLKDVRQQLRAVMAAPFRRRPLLNYSEYRAFKIIENDMAMACRGYRVFAQTSLGEVLTSPNEDAFRSINSKRVDILIVDRGGWPLVAIEYQGNGHYQDNAAARDAVKKEALRKAGVRHVEIRASDSAEQIRTRVRGQLGWETSAELEQATTK